MVEDVAIDAQRDLFLGVWQRRLLRDRFRRLGGGCLERRFGRKPWIVWSPACSVVVHVILLFACGSTPCARVPSGAGAPPSWPIPLCARVPAMVRWPRPW